jgi:hypothetical protein
VTLENRRISSFDTVWAETCPKTMGLARPTETEASWKKGIGVRGKAFYVIVRERVFGVRAQSMLRGRGRLQLRQYTAFESEPALRASHHDFVALPEHTPSRLQPPRRIERDQYRVAQRAKLGRGLPAIPIRHCVNSQRDAVLERHVLMLARGGDLRELYSPLPVYLHPAGQLQQLAVTCGVF